MKRRRNSKYEGLLARFYDADHAWRDYAGQTELLCEIFPESAERKNIRLLDLCCGPGSHALPLARRGFRVTGIDRSGIFLRIAAEKAREAGLKVDFKKGDLYALARSRRLAGRYDAAALLGWTLSIHSFFLRFPAILRSAFHVLKPGGLFVCDAAVGSDFNPVTRVPLLYRLADGTTGELTIRKVLDRKRPLCRLVYDWKIRRNGERELHLAARETLRVMAGGELLGALRNFRRMFVLRSALGGYSLEKPFQKGSKNLILVLEKCTA